MFVHSIIALCNFLESDYVDDALYGWMSPHYTQITTV